MKQANKIGVHFTWSNVKSYPSFGEFSAAYLHKFKLQLSIEALAQAKNGLKIVIRYYYLIKKKFNR